MIRASFVLGVISFVCLILYFLALTDIWRPDFWHGEGLCAFEWRFLAVCFWPMLLFHFAFLAALAVLARR